MSKGNARAAEAQRRLQVFGRYYRYQYNKRTSWDFFSGLPSAAAGGDRKSIRKCAAQAAVVLKNAEWHDKFEGLKEWLIHALGNIEAGRSPDEAFAWSQKRPGAPDAFETMQRDFLILESLAARMADNPKTPLKTLRGQVADAYGVSDETVKKIWHSAGAMADDWEGK